MSHRRSFLLAAAALLAASPSALDAQERSWRLNVVGDVGWMDPVRSLGNNATSVPELPLLQVITDVESSPFVGGGVEIDFLEHGITVRLLYNRTLDTPTDSHLAFCGDPDDPFATGELCVPVETRGRIQALAADVYFARGSPSSRVRPILSAGLGMRSYDFDPITCNDPGEWQYICELAADVWADGGGVTPFLKFGGGLQYGLGPLRTLLEAQVLSGQYNGGVDDAGGNLQIDLAFSLRVSAPVF